MGLAPADLGGDLPLPGHVEDNTEDQGDGLVSALNVICNEY